MIDAQPTRLVAALTTPARIEQAAAEAVDVPVILCKPSIRDVETVRTAFDLIV